MHVLRSGVVRLGAVLLLAVAVMAAAYGFAATNTVPDTRAGDGAGTISGYTVSNVAYTLNASNPQQLDRVEFDLDAAAGTVKVRLQTPGGTWYSCTNTSGNHWSCDTPGQGVQPANELRVVAVQ
ncbi:MAG: hypothetical protein RQ985_02190 [Dehalococcoidia bacterium]|jgi:hypothetical protein|nr:hypothetical protein [Dehalococcoidia bacterium]